MNTQREPRSGHDAAHFDAKFYGSDDPWHYRTSWYEARKRALTLGALPRLHYRRAFEPACANGELSAMLATRCSLLLCADFAPRAVKLARERLVGFAHVQVDNLSVPEDWPDGRFDLIVVSEFAYYLDEARCEALAQLAVTSLEPGGALLCCHWRHGADDLLIESAAIHDIFARHAKRADVHRVTHIEDTDFLLDVWSADQLSVAGSESAG